MSDFSLFIELGWKHIMDWRGYDHMLFIIALSAPYTAREWRKLAWLVTAFTLGHSVTLALSALDRMFVNASIVEALIPITILWSAIANLIFSPRRNASYESFKYGSVLFFGLIHGLGFSNYLKILLPKNKNIAWELLAFNLGLEIGQLLIVGAYMALSYALLTQRWIPIRRKIYEIIWSLFIILASLHLVSKYIL